MLTVKGVIVVPLYLNSWLSECGCESKSQPAAPASMFASAIVPVPPSNCSSVYVSVSDVPRTTGVACPWNLTRAVKSYFSIATHPGVTSVPGRFSIHSTTSCTLPPTGSANDCAPCVIALIRFVLSHFAIQAPLTAGCLGGNRVLHYRWVSFRTYNRLVESDVFNGHVSIPRINNGLGQRLYVLQVVV